MKSHIEDSDLLTLASGVLQKIMPTYVKDTLDSPSRQLKNLINFVSTHFQSLEKSAEIKVWNEFDAKRFNELQKVIANDISLLETYVKSIQDALSKGGNVYKSYLSFSMFVVDIEKQIMQNEKLLIGISQPFDPLSVYVASQETQVISLFDKIKNLSHEEENIIDKVGELRRFITPKLDRSCSVH